MAFTRFESTNMGSTKYAERIFDAVYTDDVENGVFGHLNGLALNEQVIYKFVPGIVGGEPIVVVDNPEWDPDECKIINQAKRNYINKAGVPFRVRIVKETDEFAVTIDGFTDATKDVVTTATDFTATNIYVTVDSTTGKLVASTSSTGSANFEGRIMRKRIDGGVVTTPLRNYGYSTNMYTIKVTKC